MLKPISPRPVVEGGGSSTGRRLLCEGTIDIANSSSLMKDSERETCAGAGVTPIEIRFGYDGIVFASDINGPSFAFEPVHWYIALAAQHFLDGGLVANELSSWADVAGVAQTLRLRRRPAGSADQRVHPGHQPRHP